jgi:4-hydroxybenzoate polyprenyltransferase
MRTLYAGDEMAGFDALDLLNTAIAVFAILGGMAYAIIKTKIDVEHLTKKVETLFNLFNNMRDRDK